MDSYNEIISMIGTIAIINLVAVILQGTKRVRRKGEGNSKFKIAVNLGLIGGLFGIYATINGYTNSNGAVIAIRDVGPMMAGCLGGPASGLIAGIIAGIHRLIVGRTNITLGTTIPCAISTVLIGLLCGMLFKPFESKKNKGIFAFFIAVIMECLHLFIVFIYTWIVSDINSSLKLIFDVAPSFLTANALAFGLMIFTTDMIDKYKEVEKNKDAIEVELNTATTIQKSMLPTILSVKNNKEEFEIYADMMPAKQVGGDFFDFYFIDEDHFAFLIADVSGKGVPSALFMAISKTIIKNNLQLGLNLKEAIEKSNKQLFEENKEFMFVTAWIAVIEISTGKLEFINAGHNPPIIKKSSKEIGYINNRSGFVLAGRKDSKYEVFETKIEKGDTLFLYTDGVTEASNISKEQYGEKRLIDFISNQKCSMENLCKNVKNDVKIFVENAEQFDDITMIAFKYNGKIDKDTIKLKAVTSNIENATDFINEKIKNIECTNKTKAEINIIIDEIVGNIAKYSYNSEDGEIDIKSFITNSPLALNIIFEDSGIPYNPLNNKKIDKNLSISEREYGGLGVGIVEKLADEIEYEYIDNKNRLLIKKYLK